MVTFLLSLNVPVSPVDRWGITPLWSAVCDGKKDIAQALRNRGGEIKQSNQTVAAARPCCALCNRRQCPLAP